MNLVSRWGVIAGGAYILFVVFLFYYASNCVGGFCGLMALLAAMPWLYLFDFLGGDIYDSGAFGYVFVALNVIIFYLLFSYLERRFKKR